MASHYGLKDRAQLKAGETLLVMGAAGGVGLAAVELGKAMGARVIAAASTQDKLDVCVEHGADDTILYPSGTLDRDQQKAFSDAIKEKAGGLGADVIYDPVGDAYAERLCAPLIGKGAIWSSALRPVSSENSAQFGTVEKLSDSRCVLGRFYRARPASQSGQFAGIDGNVQGGTIRPHISDSFPLEQAADALNKMANRQVKGKVILTTGRSEG